MKNIVRILNNILEKNDEMINIIKLKIKIISMKIILDIIKSEHLK